jgi:hypothetical protein
MSYKGSVTRIEKLSKVGLLLVMVALAGFLISLGNKVLEDCDGWISAPVSADFLDQPALQAARTAAATLEKQWEGFADTKSLYEKSRQKAQRQYADQKQSYEDWLQARATIGSSQEDKEVRGRAQALDQFRAIQESWQARMDEVDAQSAGLGRQLADARAQVSRVEGEGQERYDSAMKAFSLKVFVLRLGLVLPVLGLAIFLLLRFRKSRFWPMVWAYLFFSLYAFFLGLVPYMPSFGGYIRQIVGVLLSLLAAFYVIRQLGQYMQKKKKELEVSTQDRARAIQEEVAIRAFNSHSCPSCERNFLINKWYPKVRKASEIRTLDEAPDHCCYCGLPLFGPCPACQKRNFVHFPYCSACGVGLVIGAARAAPTGQ